MDLKIQRLLSKPESWLPLALSLALFQAQCPNPAVAQDGSLESMWMDQPPPEREESTPVAAVPQPEPSASTAAPMCSLSEFKESQFVARGTWPGVGPFTSAGDGQGEFQDSNENALRVEVNKDQVTRAELRLGKLGSGKGSRDFLDIEMTADFLLESLGARPPKIAQFNSNLEKNKDALMSRPAGMQFSAGRYGVTIDRSRAAKPYSCVIAVHSLEASKTAIREHSVEPPPRHAAPPRQAPPPVRKPQPSSQASQAINPSIDPRRDEFANLIRNWQNVKKVAIKKRETQALGEVLSGRALARQTDAIKWLAANKKFYEMTPKGVAVDKYQELTPGKKFLVLAQVREFSKYVDEATGQVLKEIDDKYTVNYTVEKIGDRYMITDSALLQPGTQSGKPGQPTKR